MGQVHCMTVLECAPQACKSKGQLLPPVGVRHPQRTVHRDILQSPPRQQHSQQTKLSWLLIEKSRTTKKKVTQKHVTGYEKWENILLGQIPKLHKIHFRAHDKGNAHTHRGDGPFCHCLLPPAAPVGSPALPQEAQVQRI